MDVLKKMIISIADAHYEEHNILGHAPSGNNGPYNYEDTPVRNTCHWLIIYCYLFKVTGNRKYKDIAIKFAKYLSSIASESKNGAIECMTGKQFDHLNGLIGQAWAIEALIYAAKTLQLEFCLEVAKGIYFSQVFDSSASLWKRVEIDGTVLDYDYTVNHQVWFAIAGCMINDLESDPVIMHDLIQFMNSLVNSHFRIYDDGLIKHYVNISRPNISMSFASKIKREVKRAAIPLHYINPNKYDVYAQERGYHLFELYGYAILKEYLPEHALFKTESFLKAVKYGLDIEKLNRQFNIKVFLKPRKNFETNKYAYGYNSPAFEFPLISDSFGNDIDCEKIDSLIRIQIDGLYNSNTKMFDRNNSDSQTLTARMYELIRYLDRKESRG
ncbi:MAG: hypothetical protein LUH07_00685 [Lachnospiraceae bacterium]|nr:hypothetical protein [Lachnospiraceae bacterium]